MADLERAKSALINAHKAGDTVAAKKLANYIKSQQQPMDMPAPQQAAPEPRSEQNFFERMGSNFERRQQNVRDVRDAGKPFLAGSKAIGQAAGLGNDIVSEAMTSGFRALPDFIETPIRQKASDVMAGPVGQYLGMGAEAGAGAWGQFKEAYPNVASVTEDVANSGMFLAGVKPTLNTVGKTATTTKNVIKSPISGTGKMIEAKSMRKGFAARGAEEMDDVTQAMKNQSSDLYRQSKEAGALINRNKGVNIVNRMKNKIGISSEKAVHSRLYGDTLSVIDDMEQAAKTGNLSLEDIDGYRQLLNDAVSKNYGVMGPSGDAKKAIDAINELDDLIEGLAPIDIIGGDTGAIDSLIAGRAQWAKARKFETVSQVIKNANGDPNKIKTGFQRILKDKKKTRGFLPEELKAIEDASKYTMNETIMKGLGRFGVAPENVFNNCCEIIEEKTESESIIDKDFILEFSKILLSKK